MTHLDLLWIVPLMLVLLALKGFFSGSEIALVNADRIRLGHAAKQGSKGAKLVIELFRRPERVLTTTLIGTNIATVSLTTLGTLLMIHYLGSDTGDLFAVLFYTPLLLILGEIVPKAIYQEKADAVAPIVVFPLRVFSWLFAPLVVTFGAVAGFAARRFGARASVSMFATRDQLRALMEIAERQAGARVFDRFRIERAIRFPETTVGQCMTPAPEMVAIDRGAAISEAAQLVRRKGHTRIPVYEGNVSNVVGVLTLTPWDLLEPGLLERPLADLVRPAIYVPASEALEDLAPLLRERGERMAIVVDEYGSAIGLLTQEDLMEAVVGPIELGYTFEEPVAREVRRYELLEDGSYRMDARLPIAELCDLLEIELPQGDFHTVGGLVMSLARRMVREGESFRVGDYRFVVEEVGERAIRRVRVEAERSGDGASG